MGNHEAKKNGKKRAKLQPEQYTLLAAILSVLASLIGLITTLINKM